MTSDSAIKGFIAGAGATLLLMYLYKKNHEKIGGFAREALDSVPGNLYPLKCMSDEKLEELKESIEDVVSERKATEKAETKPETKPKAKSPATKATASRRKTAK